MPRLLILWTSPTHLSEDEAGAWVREQLGGVLGEQAVLSRLERAGGRWCAPFDWLLEVAVPDGAAAAADYAELLGDLRLLGMRPAAMVAVDGGPA